MPSCFLATLHASAHFFSPLLAQRFLPRADIFLDTTFPDLLLTSSVFYRPDVVFSFRPKNTRLRASLPLAILLSAFAFFIDLFFIDFLIAFFFIPPLFIAFFMAFFMPADFFMGSAIEAIVGPEAGTHEDKGARTD